MLDMLGDFDRSLLVAIAGQDLDEATQENVARNQQEQEHKDSLEESPGEGARARKQGRPQAASDARSLGRATGRLGIAADIAFRVLQKLPNRFDRRGEEKEVGWAP